MPSTMSLHHLDKFAKEILRIVGSGRGLGVVLDRKDWQGLMSHPFAGLVIEIDLGQLHFLGIERHRVDTKPMILRRDRNLSCSEVLDGLVGPQVTEFQLECPAPIGQSQELVPQTDPEDRPFIEELSDCIHGIGERLRVSGSVGQEDSIRVMGQDRFCC